MPDSVMTCTSCGKGIDGYARAYKSPGVKRFGGFGMCAHCQTILVFADDGVHEVKTMDPIALFHQFSDDVQHP